jgi:transposase, IS30 family
LMGGCRVDAAAMEMVWRVRSGGASVAVAAELAGVEATTARRRVVAAGGIRPRPARAVSGRFLSVSEREEIALGLAGGLSQAVIARRLGRHRSTISREVARNGQHRFRAGGGGGGDDLGRGGRPRIYRAIFAQQHAERRRARPKPAKLAVQDELRGWVQHGLDQRWSPEQIASSLRVEFPDRPEMRVSHETIYQSLYVQSRGALRRELTVCLRTGRAIRRPQRRIDERRGRIAGMVMISERPPEVADRAVPGHWEGDLIIGKDGKSAIGTLVERSTRFVMLLHLPPGPRPDTVAAAMVAQMTHLPEHLRRSLTWDQGKEMSRHAQISTALDLPIYFCDPHSPWQRGSNENTNGLLRQYFPKGTNLAIHHPEHLDAVAAQLNGRPRKTLDWHNPAEQLNKLLVATTA